ncbi:MAG TPA: hypothetical protein VFQ22_08215 [Longimicrobiales bacterium]|nr:hypothetical protein [Longimicrobiales bacterium]
MSLAADEEPPARAVAATSEGEEGAVDVGIARALQRRAQLVGVDVDPADLEEAAPREVVAVSPALGRRAGGRGRERRQGGDGRRDQRAAPWTRAPARWYMSDTPGARS